MYFNPLTLIVLKTTIVGIFECSCVKDERTESNSMYSCIIPQSADCGQENLLLKRRTITGSCAPHTHVASKSFVVTAKTGTEYT
jgi:hypothetical protein